MANSFSFTFDHGGLTLDVTAWDDHGEITDFEVRHGTDDFDIEGIAEKVNGEWVTLHQLLSDKALDERHSA